MARTRTVHRCRDCGATTARWQGRCPTCGQWNSLVERTESAVVTRTAVLVAGAEPRAISALDACRAGAEARATGLGELDRVLGGGLVAGSVSLLGGAPGIGKSTLALQAAGAMAASGTRVLYLSAEESVAQVGRRAERVGAAHGELWVAAATSIDDLHTLAREIEPQVVMVDSIQTVHHSEVAAAPGSVSQVRACATALVGWAKEAEVACVLVGHVTKDGSLAGPRVLEHLVDTVLAFEGDRHHSLRLLRVVKHRFGPAGEVGVFEMREAGLAPVPDPSGLFLADRRSGVAGSAVASVLDQRRPLLVELQALVTKVTVGGPVRSTQGLERSRLDLVLALLTQRVGFPFTQCEVYASAVGGVRITDPGADLPLALALVAALADRPVPDDVVAFGEIGLCGELRRPPHLEARLREAARFGFARALVPAGTPAVEGIELVTPSTAAEALVLAGFDLP